MRAGNEIAQGIISYRISLVLLQVTFEVDQLPGGSGGYGWGGVDKMTWANIPFCCWYFLIYNVYVLDGYQIWDTSVLLYIHVRIYIFRYHTNANCIWYVFFPYFWNQGASCSNSYYASRPRLGTGRGAEKIGAWPWNKSVKSHPLLQRWANARTRSQKKNSVPSVALINITWKVSI